MLAMKQKKAPRRGERQHRAREQIDRQDRFGLGQRMAHQQHAEDHADRHDRERDHGRSAMHHRLEPGEDQSERRHVEHCARQIVAAAPRRHVGQGDSAEQERQYAERGGGGEHPRPGRRAQDQPADRGRDGRRDRDDDAVDAEPAAEMRGRVDLPHQRLHHRERRRAADRLQRAHHQQEWQAVGEEAQDGRDGEQQLPSLVEPLEPDQIAERRAGQQRHHQHELVDGHDQYRRRPVDLEVARDGGEGDGCDRAVDHGQHRAERKRYDRPITSGQRQAGSGCGVGNRTLLFGHLLFARLDRARIMPKSPGVKPE
jgi:hypothetical protein